VFSKGLVVKFACRVIILHDLTLSVKGSVVACLVNKLYH